MQASAAVDGSLPAHSGDRGHLPHIAPEVGAAGSDYIEVLYNRARLHSGLDYRTPAEARASMEGVATRAAA